MAVISWEGIAGNVNGSIYRATPLATGDTTAVLNFVDGNWDVTVHVYGTVGGASVDMTGGIVSEANLAALQDAFGDVMSFTVLPAIKPVGPAILKLQGAITGGAGTGISIDVFVTKSRG